MTDGLLIDCIPSESNCEFGFFGGCHSFALGSFFGSYAILANSDAAQICRELKAIMDFPFLTWILRNTFALSVHMSLTV
jgi:hypothetical protein